MQQSLSFSLSFCFLCCNHSLLSLSVFQFSMLTERESDGCFRFPMQPSLQRERESSVSYAATTLFLSLSHSILSVFLFHMLPSLSFSLSVLFPMLRDHSRHSLSLCLSVSYAAITLFLSVFLFPMQPSLSVSLSFYFLCCQRLSFSLKSLSLSLSLFFLHMLPGLFLSDLSVSRKQKESLSFSLSFCFLCCHHSLSL